MNLDKIIEDWVDKEQATGKYAPFGYTSEMVEKAFKRGYELGVMQERHKEVTSTSSVRKRRKRP